MGNILRYFLEFLYSVIFCFVILMLLVGAFYFVILLYFIAAKFFVYFLIFILIAAAISPFFINDLKS